MSTLISQVILKIASRCNLNCNYCYVYNQEDTGFISRPKTISDEVFYAVLKRIDQYCERHDVSSFVIAFHGGEPTLVGIDRFTELVTRARSILTDKLGIVALQTNGTLLNEQWANAIRQNGVVVSVSL